MSLSLRSGEILAIVGESGSGKSVTAMAVTRLLRVPPAKYLAGEIWVNCQNVLTLPEAQLRSIRGAGVGYIFQDPGASLNPVFTIRRQMAESIVCHRSDIAHNRKSIEREIIAWLDRVGINQCGKSARSLSSRV